MQSSGDVACREEAGNHKRSIMAQRGPRHQSCWSEDLTLLSNAVHQRGARKVGAMVRPAFLQMTLVPGGLWGEEG